VQALPAGAGERYALDAGLSIKSLCALHDRLLVVSCSGRAMLFAPGAADSQSIHVKLQRKCWVAHLNVRVSTLFAAFGSTSATPLTVHALAEDALPAQPRPRRVRAVPALVRRAVDAPNALLVSGCFDDAVRC
jgi:hypothetical protein